MAPDKRSLRIGAAAVIFAVTLRLLSGGALGAAAQQLVSPELATLLVFLETFIALSGRGCRSRKDYWGATVTFLVLCAVAFGINCAFWNISGGQINMFFVGPANSSLVVFNQISEMLGWYVSTAVYIPATCLGAYVIYLGFRFVQRKLPVCG